jgi:hypothetical protein
MHRLKLLSALICLVSFNGSTWNTLHADEPQLTSSPSPGTEDQPELLARQPPATTASIRATMDDDGVLFTEGDSKILFYQRRTKSLDEKYARANYIHPLFDLDGNVLTEDFPVDHLHHRGIFWAWHQLWVHDKKIGDGWTCSRFSWEVQQLAAEIQLAGPATLRAKVLWQSPDWVDDQGKPKPLVDESTLLHIHPQREGVRYLDFDIRLLALEEELSLGGSEDDKGYGGFSVRIHLPDDVQFHGRDGLMEPQLTAIAGGPWLDITGSFNAPGQRNGLAVLCHPSSAGYPQPWILRSKRSMQNAAFPGQHPIPLSTTQPLVLRYRVVLHREPVDAATIDKWQAEYAQQQ